MNNALYYHESWHFFIRHHITSKLIILSNTINSLLYIMNTFSVYAQHLCTIDSLFGLCMSFFSVSTCCSYASSSALLFFSHAKKRVVHSLVELLRSSLECKWCRQHDVV